MTELKSSTNLLIPVDVQMMTSREIAELTEKQHSHVCRDIRNMLDQIYDKESKYKEMDKDAPEYDRGTRKQYKYLKPSTLDRVLDHFKDDPDRDHNEIQGVIEERDERGYVGLYRLDREHTLTLIAGYRADLRFRIIKRWQELESSVQLPDFTKPAEAARAWALQYERAEQEKLEKEHALQKAQEAQPMVQFHEEVTRADGELKIDEVCAVLFHGAVKPKQFRIWLKTQHWMDARPGMNKPTAWAMTQGYMRLRLSPPINGRVFEVPVVTGSGLTLLRHLYRTNELFINAIPIERRLAAPQYPV